MSETLGVGSEIAGYRVLGLLGRGGMGFVYDAEHAILGRKAAIKTLSNDLGSDGDFRERFIQESQMVAALDHPSIIPIYDAGEEDGIVYIAMRHVGGGDLQDLIAKGLLELDRAVSILEQVAGALDAAHAHDLVHRDVKPANVLIDSSSDRVYLTDFGIAKRSRTRGLTRTGFFVGTLDYAAPEQIQGKPVGPQADVYAFGCLLFECLTGQKPFDRETDVAVMHAHLLDPAPAPTELRPELPAALDDIVARALAKNEVDRTATCREVIEAVRASLGGQPVAPAARASTITSRTSAVFVNFPTEPSPLIGRNQELADLVELARGAGRAARDDDRPGRHRQDPARARGRRRSSRRSSARRSSSTSRRSAIRTSSARRSRPSSASRRQPTCHSSKASRAASATIRPCSCWTTSSRCCPRRRSCTSCSAPHRASRHS